MAVYVSNIVIEQGFDFDTSFQLEDTRTNALLDLTGATTLGQIRKSSSSINKISFDVKIISSGGKEYKAIEGSALVRGGVTR